MTVVVVIFLPLVLAYQTWTYYVFRRRVSRDEFVHGPAARRAARAVPAQGAVRRRAGAPTPSAAHPEGAKT